MNLKKIVEAAWDDRTLLQEADVQSSINEVVEQLDSGLLRVANKEGDKWVVNDWVKKAVILYFPIRQMESIEVPPFEFHDKIPLKTGYKANGIRVVPHAVARYGAYISKELILMPSY